jgi:Zn-dependent peptidase ImmA (M78 family)
VGQKTNSFFNDLESLSKKCNINQEAILKWETGLDYPTINQAKNLAKAYKMPFATFYLSEPPTTEIKSYPDRRSLFHTKPISCALWSKIADLINCRKIALLLLNNNDLTHRPLPHFDKNEKLANIATLIRQNLDISKSDKKSFSYFRSKIEKSGILVFQIHEIPVSEFTGLSLHYDTLPIIAVNSGDSDNAKVFSLFHELSHLVRRESSLCLIDFNEFAISEELECNRLSAEILMPSSEVVNILIEKFKMPFLEQINLNLPDDKFIDSYAKRFGVSSQAFLRKLYDLGCFTQTSYQQKNSDFSKRIANPQKNGHPNYPRKFLSEYGFLFTYVILSAYSNKSITIGEASRYLGVKTTHIDSLCAGVL